MPLARISNGANTEPKKKRAKTEKKVTKTKSKTAALNVSTSSTENDDSLAINDPIPTPTPTTKSSSLSSSIDSTSTKSVKTNNKNKTSEVDKSIAKDLDNTANKTATSNLTANFTMNTNYDDTMMTDLTNQSEVNGDSSNQIKIVSRTKTKPGVCLSVGENISNQLGLTLDISDRKKPQIIKDLPESIIEIAAGGMHSACLTEDGIVIKLKIIIIVYFINFNYNFEGLYVWLQ